MGGGVGYVRGGWGGDAFSGRGGGVGAALPPNSSPFDPIRSDLIPHYFKAECIITMRALCMDSLDPALNLALEEHLFTSLPKDHPGWFLLWSNGPSIIVGRHQNTLEEVNQGLVEKHGLVVVRRMTGGGAVYHDAGNLNFSFIHRAELRKGMDFSVYLAPVVCALEDMGIRAVLSGRNDLEVAGRKVSGSAQMRRQGKVLHHGTLLVDLDLDMLEAVLSCAPDKYLSKGVASIRARVANLSEFAGMDFSMGALREALLRRCASERVGLSEGDFRQAEEIAASKYRLWEWNYGASPPFTEKWRERFSWGSVECCLLVRDGIIKQCAIRGDFFSREDIGGLESCFVGMPHRREAIRSALEGVELADYFSGCDVERMRMFFVGGRDIL